MKVEVFPYFLKKERFLGYLAQPKEDTKKKPVVLIAHAWLGQNEYARQMTEKFCEQGYIAMALDLYGEGKIAKDREEAKELVSALHKDTQLICDRVNSAIDVISTLKEADGTKIALVGYCFGGFCAIEALRSQSNLCGVVSVHATLGAIEGSELCRAPWGSGSFAPLLLLHGHLDPLVSKEELSNFKDEMTEHGVDWQIVIYSNTMHGFTNPKANAPQAGVVYEPKSAARSWQHTLTFLQEVFDG